MPQPLPSRAFAALAFLLVLPAAGCEAATNAANGAGAFAERAAAKIEQKTGDTALTIAVKGALVRADDKLGGQVKVGALDGVVSLSGVVATPEDKARAEQIALGVKGVVRVMNAIDVGPVR